MKGTSKTEALEDFAIIAGSIGVQFAYAGNSVLLSYLMFLGLNPLTIIIFSASVTFLLLSPLSVYFERSKWPKKLSLRLLIQLVLISLGGVTLFQSLFLKGIKLTSPAMATAMPNLAPGLIFVIAVAIRLEKVKLSCMYSKVKILGTLMCVIGAIIMSMMQSTMTPKGSHRLASPPPLVVDLLFDRQRIIGCVYLMLAVLVLSSSIVLQAFTLVEFPAPVSLCAITSLIGVIITIIVELIQDHKFDVGWPVVSVRDLIAYSVLGGAISGACFSFNGWAIKKRGPVFVSMFSPIGTVLSIFLSFITTGDYITLGSFTGMFLMFIGLYFYLWAKGKEDFLFKVGVGVGVGDGDEDRDEEGNRNASESEYDAATPLLS